VSKSCQNLSSKVVKRLFVPWRTGVVLCGFLARLIMVRDRVMFGLSACRVADLVMSCPRFSAKVKCRWSPQSVSRSGDEMCLKCLNRDPRAP
jgi:hypothetical protein